MQAAVDELAARLTAPLLTPDEARRKPAEGGVPNEPGLYAWWLDRSSLAALPLQREANGRWLLYLGIAPSRPGTRQQLRGRVCGNHLRGNISGSTFRLSLAALLWQHEGWSLARRGNRALLTAEANAALSEWQRRHLRVAWVVQARPWEWESRIIKVMAPALNLAQNRNDKYGWALSEARQRLRVAALSSTP